MRSIEVAMLFIGRQRGHTAISNLSLNKLVYLAQVESLKTRNGMPLFDDRIEAWDYGPVEPVVYHMFKQFGRDPVSIPSDYPISSIQVPDYATRIVDSVLERYGSLSAFDLVNITHREGGAWKNVYVAGGNAEITIEDILASEDCNSEMDLNKTLTAGVRSVEKKWPNALRMLQDA